MSEQKIIKDFVVFRGKPLVRNGSILIYGSMSEAAYADMLVLAEGKEVTEMGAPVDIFDTIMVNIYPTNQGHVADPAKKEPLRIQEFKKGLFQALEYAYEQIERFNSKFNA